MTLIKTIKKKLGLISPFDDLKPCVGCLSKRIYRHQAGPLLRPDVNDRLYKIIQCKDCGENRTADSWERVEAIWNGLKVWEKVK